jgi:glutamyl-Q tRNA(Asp) synthetase
MSGPVLRFAPSPNGYLHLGHAYSALFTWRAAAALGGTALLRIEDIDRARCKPEFDAAIIDDLKWLGLSWPEPLWRQSQRFSAYEDAARQLSRLLYPCACTRTEIADRANATDPDGAPLYDGRCRRHPPERGVPVQWRLNMDDAIASAGGLEIHTLPTVGNDIGATLAWRAAEPGRWGDAVIVRKDVPTSYHLSVVVDDAAQGVTHVTRGRDLEAATDLHVLLQSLLGLPAPVYTHHDLVRDNDNEKLSKSNRSTSLRDLRTLGWSANKVRTTLGF